MPWICPWVNGRLWTKAADCDYNEYDRKLTEQFRHGVDDETMISKISRSINNRKYWWCYQWMGIIMG